jgi:ubiquinone/menaquinone biosynthesis C-methylase UbiE
VLEYGCGDGQISVALAPHVGRVIGLDIDADMVRAGRERAARAGAENVELDSHPAEEIVDVLRAHAGEVDVLLLYAVLEHLSLDERFAVLEAAREVVPADGAIVCIETPNRLISFDSHSSHLPYMNWLPDELARRYADRSPRELFVEGLRAARAAGPAEEAEWWVRFGRGMSFHEFELVFGDIERHVVAGGYDTAVLPARPLQPEELPLAADLARRRPDLGPAWSRQWLDLVLSPSPLPEPARFVRPWSMETGESPGVAWTRWGSLGLPEPGLTLRVRPDAPTARLVLGFIAPPGEAVVTLTAGGDPVGEVRTHAGEEMVTRYVDVAWEGEADMVEITFSTQGHVLLVACEA